jgi:hypothetical protein
MPLDYYAMRDQQQLGAEQPALSNDLAIRRIALTPGATFRPGEFESLMLLARNAQMQQGNRDAINQFYDSPERQREIDMAIRPVQEAAFLNLLNQLRSRSRQEAFARAESGNIGGSVQASQEAGLSGDASRAGSQLANQFAGERDRLMQALEAARVNEILSSYDLDPQLMASLKQRAHTYGVQDQGNALLDQLRRNRDELQRGHDDEFSRAWGNLLNVGNQQYQIYNRNQQAQEYQDHVNRARGGQ